MVNAQEWLNRKYSTSDAKAEVKRIGPKQDLYLEANHFYGSLKPLRNLTNLRGIGIANTDVDSGSEYLPEIFFNVNATTSDLGLTGAWKRDNQGLINKAKEQAKQEELIEIAEWDILGRET
ncbi:hypothetical protein C1646_749009 [Rhizophagus diaphanus]|nr:hypothetical protein C1646_749009 [Rhizophagus diaphanus] [Rhizophagus sp. MUCL 43196]